MKAMIMNFPSTFAFINRLELSSLRSRRLDVVAAREKGRARGRHPRVSPSRAPVFSCAHYFQASATQAKNLVILR